MLNQKLFTCKEVYAKFPQINSNTLDYLVRNKIVKVIQRGKGIDRLFSEESISQITFWLIKNGRNTSEVIDD